MGSIISNNSDDPNDYLQMSNSLTSIFIEVICLAGADIATEDFQKDLMVWFAQRDWQLIGMGFEGFDVSQIIWDKDIFTRQKKFILQVLDRAMAKQNWHLLDYSPKEEWVMESLKKFKGLINAFGGACVPEESILPIIGFEGKYSKCPKHQIFLHIFGCVICNHQ